MKNVKILLWLFVCFSLAAPCFSQANTTFLFGKGKLQEHKPPNQSTDYFFYVKLSYEGDPKTNMDAINLADWRKSDGDLYCYRADINSQVTLTFFHANYTSTDLKLNVNDSYGKAVRAIALLSPIPTKSIQKKKAAPAKTSASDLRSDLDSQRRLARIAGAYDTAQWNIAALKYAYEDEPVSAKVFQKFDDDNKSEVFMQSKYKKSQELYAQIIARNDGGNVQVEEQQLVSLVRAQNDYSMAPLDIRSYAMDALGNNASEKPLSEETLNYLREQSNDLNAPLFRPARAALAKIGTVTDKSKIIAYLKSPFQEHVLASVIAIGRGKMTTGRDALKKLAEDPNTSPEVVDSAKAFLEEWDAAEPKPLSNSAEQKSFASVQDIWNDGVLNNNMEMHALTTLGKKDWFATTNEGQKRILEIDYPGDPLFGYLQFMVKQPSVQPRTVNYSKYTHFVIELKSAQANSSVKFGLKASFDPDKTILFESILRNVSTDWKPYPIPLNASTDEDQIRRLQNLKIPVQLSFTGESGQRFYVRRMYFAGP